MKLSLKIAAIIGLAATLLVLLISSFSLQRDVALVEADIRRDARLVAASVAVLVQGMEPAAAQESVARVARQIPELEVSWTTSAVGVDTFDRVEAVASAGGGHFVHVAESLAPRERARTSALRTMAVMASVVLAISLVGGLWVGRLLVGRRVDALVQKARRVAQGEFDQPVPYAGGDELALLASELNRMAGQLKTAQIRSRSDAEARLEAEVQLRHADRLRTVGQLSAGIAHELGTPLNVVSGRAALLMRLPLEPNEVAHVNVILEQTGRITDLVQGLMDYARRRPPSVASTDLAGLAGSVIQLLKPTLKATDTALEFDAPGPAMANVDAEQITQVLTNLIMNAAQAAAGGTVRVGLRGGNGQCVVEVEDDGPGVADDIREQVMEPFFTTKEPGLGSGLGLSVVESIVRRHGGTIQILTSELGGALFRVTLPGGLP